MRKYCNTVKNKLNILIRNMEKNSSAFVADPKRDFVRKSELSFSKTMRFILGMGSHTLGKELMNFYGYDPKMVSVSAVVQRRSKYFLLLFSICSISSTRHSHRQISFTDTDFMLLLYTFALLSFAVITSVLRI